MPCEKGLTCADGTSCKTSCTSDGDCASGTQRCDFASGACLTPSSDAGTGDIGILTDAAPPLAAKPTITASYQTCAKDSDCPTMHCVEGVCCDTACTDRCHSCKLLDSPGKCTLEPAGVDLRNECGATDTCTGTCGPTGECIGSGAGSLCAPNLCTGPSSGIGAAYCSAPGAACSNAGVAAFDCTPFICQPAFGACLSMCSTSNDCANGYQCDITTRACVATPPSDTSHSCAVSEPGDSSHDTVVVWAIGAAALLARRRRRA
jgi:MYXO-CTERM domain-containing protein